MNVTNSETCGVFDFENKGAGPFYSTMSLVGLVFWLVTWFVVN